MTTRRHAGALGAAILIGVLAGCGGGSSGGGVSTVPTAPTPTPIPTPTPVPNPGVPGQSSRYLYAVDADGDKVVSFRVDSTTGTLYPGFSAPMQGGAQGVSIAVQGNHLYVPDAANFCIDAFEIQPDGRLNPIQSPLGIDLIGTKFLAMRVAPNGHFAYAADTGGNIYPLAIDSTTGELSTNGALVSTGLAPTVLDDNSLPFQSPSTLLIHPNGKFLYLAGGGQIAAFAIQGNGSLQSTGSVSSPSPGFMTIDPAGQFLYVSNTNDNNVTQYSLNGNTGVPVPLSTASVPTGHGPMGVAVEPTGHFLYVANAQDATISQFKIGTGGALTPVGTALPVGGGAAVAVGRLSADASGKFLYVTTVSALNLAAVQRFSIAGDGTLTQAPDDRFIFTADTEIPMSSGSQPATTTPQAVYVLNHDGTVAAFAIGSGGGLTLINTQVTEINSSPTSEAMVTHPDGTRTLYVTFQGSDVLALALDADGSMEAPVVLNQSPSGASAMVDQTQRYLLTLNSPTEGDSTVFVSTIEDDGSLGAPQPFSTGVERGVHMAQDYAGSDIYITHSPSGGGELVLMGLPPDGQMQVEGTQGTGNPSSQGGLATIPTLPAVLTTDATNSTIDLFTNLDFTFNPPATTSTGKSPVAIAADPTGRFAYAAIAGVVPHLAGFTADSSGDVVTNGIFGTDPGPVAVKVDPTGHFVYSINTVTAGAQGTVSQFSVNSDGSLTDLSPATVSSQGVGPVDMLITGVTQ